MKAGACGIYGQRATEQICLPHLRDGRRVEALAADSAEPAAPRYQSAAANRSVAIHAHDVYIARHAIAVPAMIVEIKVAMASPPGVEDFVRR